MIHFIRRIKAPAQLAPRCSVFASLTPMLMPSSGDIFVSAGLLGILPNVDTWFSFYRMNTPHHRATHTKRMARRYAASVLATTALLTKVAAMGTSTQLIEDESVGVRWAQHGVHSIRSEQRLAEHTRDQEDDAMKWMKCNDLGAHPFRHYPRLKPLSLLRRYL